MRGEVLWRLDEETDWRTFERLATDLLYRNGYSDIVPVEGPRDGGRDAQSQSHRGQGTRGEVTFFQFSMEADWKSKLRRELRKVRSGSHSPEFFVFVTTRTVRGEELDPMVAEARDQYGTHLTIFSREWLRLQLETAHPDLAGRYLGVRTDGGAQGRLDPSLDHEFQVDVSRIDRFAPKELLGREAELTALDHTWAQRRGGGSGGPAVLVYVAWGGEGKTSLLAKWIAGLAEADWPGCEGAFAWSFYSQGTDEGRIVSSDPFLHDALKFFGDPSMAESARTPVDKARRLAALLSERRHLLILDGIEPLQHPPSSPLHGHLKDKAVSVLLKQLAARSRGLCVVTTRYNLLDLAAYHDHTVREEELQRLSTGAGVTLLRVLGTHGSEKALAALVEDVRGHALTLHLLGTYLRDAHAGDVRKRHMIRLEEADAEVQGGHAFRVIAAYVAWLRTGGIRGERLTAVLQMLGLFDRPASSACLGALQRGPPIPGITDAISRVSDTEWAIVLSRLEESRLLTVNRDSAEKVLSVDTHPLIREFFASQMRRDLPSSWKEAHHQLYGALTEASDDGPPSPQRLEELYQAVQHGCAAGEHASVWHDVVERRLERDSHFAALRLGLIETDLAALACFFDQPWVTLNPLVPPELRADILCHVAFRLAGVGRLGESIAVSRRGLEIDVGREHWRGAAIIAHNLSEVYLIVGETLEAASAGEAALDYARKSGEWIEIRDELAVLAYALWHRGDLTRAAALFSEAERVQRENDDSLQVLFGMRGYMYCNFLLRETTRAAWQVIARLRAVREGTRVSLRQSAEGTILDACQQVGRRIEQMRLISKSRGASLLTMALDQLLDVRCAVYKAILRGHSHMIADRVAACDAALDRLREAGQQQYVPVGLLARSMVSWLAGDLDRTVQDLDEAWSLSESSGMRLHAVEVLNARLRFFAPTETRDEMYPWGSFEEDLTSVRRLSEECGFMHHLELHG